MKLKKILLAIVFGLLANTLSYAEALNGSNTWIICFKNYTMGDVKTQDITKVLLRKISGNDYLMSYSVLKKDYYSSYGRWTSLVPAKVSLNPINFSDEAGKIQFHSTSSSTGIISNQSTRRENVLSCEITTEAKMIERSKIDRVGMDPRPNQEIRKLLGAE